MRSVYSSIEGLGIRLIDLHSLMPRRIADYCSFSDSIDIIIIMPVKIPLKARYEQDNAEDYHENIVEYLRRSSL